MKTPFRRAVRLCPSALAVACVPVFAQVPAPALSPVVVTATRTEVPLREVLADVTVIERAALERQAGRSVADVLASVPGFQMSRNGGPSGTTSLFVRGGDQRFTAVLVDGVRVDTQTTGGATWEAIPLAQIERIEILRGPASAVYGSDAISGVVQIFTRKGEPGTRLDLGLGGGTFGTTKADAGVSGKAGPFDYALSGVTDRSHGFNAKTNGNPDRDGYRADGGSGRLGWDIVPGQRVEVSALRHRTDGQYDAASNPRVAVDDHSVHVLETARALWSAQWLPAWQSTVTLARSEDHYATRPSVYETTTEVQAVTVQNQWRLGAHSASLTLERREDALENNGLAGGTTLDRDQDAVAFGYGWRGARWAVQANARHDRNDTFGSVDTGSVAVGVDVATGWRVQSSVGNGFRAPTLYQQHAAEFGNAALVPERSRSNMELALHRRAGAFDGSVTVYRNRVSDLIVFGGPNPALCTYEYGCYENVAGVSTLKGVTLAGGYTLDGLRVTGSIDFLSARRADGRDLARRARRHGVVKVEKDLGDTTVGAEVRAQGKRYDRDTSDLVLGGFTVVNVDLTHRLTSTWRAVARVDNLFDKRYETAATFRTQPMAVFVGLRWTPSLQP